MTRDIQKQRHIDPLRRSRRDEAITLGSESQIDSRGVIGEAAAHVSVLFLGNASHEA